jgi:Multicopper oxidase
VRDFIPNGLDFQHSFLFRLEFGVYIRPLASNFSSCFAIKIPHDLAIMFHFALLFAASLFAQTASAATLNYNWDITWVQANPDGRLTRPVIGINGKWPNPPIIANLGDNVVVTVNNKLGNESTTIHWHGLFQVGNNNNDGPPG